MSRNFFNFIQLLILLILLIICFYFYNFSLSKQFIGYDLLVVLISSIIFIKKRSFGINKKNYFTVSFLFLLGFIIVHFQAYLEFFLNPKFDLTFKEPIPISVIPKAAIISTISLLSYYLGYYLFLLLPKFKNIPNVKKFKFTDHPPYILLSLSVFFLITFFTFIDKGYFFGGYGDMMNQEAGIGIIPEYSQQYLLLSIYSFVILHTWNLKLYTKNISLLSYLKTYPKIFILVITIYLSLNLLSGDRGPMVSILVCLFGGYVFISNKPITFFKILSLSSVAIGMLIFIGIFRDIDSTLSLSDRFNTTSEIAKNINNGSKWIFPYTDELAVIVRTHHVMVDLVDKSSIIYGIGIINNLLATIPGFGMLFSLITGIPQELMSSSEVVTAVMNADHGMGTTCVADIYWNVGVLGSVFVFILFGIIVAYVDNFIQYKCNFFTYIFWMYLIVAGIGIGRATFTGIFRNVFFIFILIFINSLSTKKINEKDIMYN